MASILNNISALGASRQLGVIGTSLQQTIRRLTTGKRINSASDDAAGLGISNKLNMDIKVAAHPTDREGTIAAAQGAGYVAAVPGSTLPADSLATASAATATASKIADALSTLSSTRAKQGPTWAPRCSSSTRSRTPWASRSRISPPPTARSRMPTSPTRW